MTSLDEALAQVERHAPDWGAESLSCAEALGRVLAQDAVAPQPVPRFNNSAMDGWAVGSLGKGPWQVVGEVAAGRALARALRSGEAVRIFTGAPVPEGSAAVVAQEDAHAVGGSLASEVEVVAGAHVRPLGEEFQPGDVVVPAGTRVTPPVLGALASLGLSRVMVRMAPKVVLLVTGDELVEPGAELGEAGVWESNSACLLGLMASAGCHALVHRVPDDLGQTLAALRSAGEEADVVVTVGGVSVGDHDHVAEAACAAGFAPVFAGVRMKPGKPTSFGVRPDGRAWFGLPGNPLSALTSALMFVLPYVGAACPSVALAADTVLSRKPGREEMTPGARTASGFRFCRVVGSHSVAGMLGADLLVRVPADQAEVKPGDRLTCYLLPWSAPCPS